MLTADALARLVPGAAREALLLEAASRTAAGYTAAERTRMRALVREGQDRAFVAEQAADGGHAASALALYREAALLFMAARLAVEGQPTSDGSAPSPAELRARFRTLPVGAPPGGPAALEAVLAEPAPASDEETIGRARATVRWLRGLVEPRDLAELRFVRDLRVGLAGLAVLALLAWSASSLFRHKNVALHKPVTTSGVFPSATSPPSGLTDGVIAGAPYGVHTQVGEAPWVEVDLLRVYAIDRIKVYNRGDGWIGDGLPMTLQLSTDDVVFSELDKRTATFTQIAPWVVKAHGRPARYVRIRGARGKYVTLSELEVFAR